MLHDTHYLLTSIYLKSLLIFVFKVLHDMTSDFFVTYFVSVNDKHCHNTRSFSFNLFIPQKACYFAVNFVKYNGAFHRNSLTEGAKCTKSLQSFINQLNISLDLHI